MSLTISPSPFGSLVVSVAETGSTLSVTTVATSPSVLTMALGVPGPAGATGATGASGTNGTNGTNGVGVPVGGTAGQVLSKINSTNYNTQWITPSSGGGTWGSITGTLSNQTDLQNALNAKLSISAAASTYLPLTGGTVTGDTHFGNIENVITVDVTGTLTINNATTTYIGDGIQISDVAGVLSIYPSGITFPDSTYQTTAALPLTGGTVSGSVTIDGGNNFTVTGGDGDIIKADYNANEVKLGLGSTSTLVSQDWITVPRNSSEHIIIGRNYEGADEFGIKFANNTFQNTAWLGYNGTTSQYITGSGSLVTFPPVGDRYLTSSTSTMTVDSGNGKTMTVGTGLSYSPQQDITVSYNTANHMHGTVLTYNSTTGVMTWDSNTHSGSGTYSSWEVNVGGVAGAILPVGGTAGQVLAKINSTNFNTEWISLGSMAQATTTDYLAKADNLSGLASTTTARTNLGLGTMATATATDYLAKADNLSGLASASTARTNLGLGTASTLSSTAVAQTANNLSDLASASTARTNLGLGAVSTDAYATTAQAQAGTSTTAVINPSTLLDAKYFQGGRFLNQISLSSGSSGTGASSAQYGANGRLLTAPTTATGNANYYNNITNSGRGNSLLNGFDWSKRFTFGFRLCRNVASPDTNSVFRAKFGPVNANIGDISGRGMEVKIAGSGAIQLLVHNGTTLTTTTSSYSLTNAVAFDVTGVSDGSGNATLYVNGSSVATSTGAATTSVNFGCYTMFEVENTSTISSGTGMIMNVSDIFIQQNI